MSNIVLDNKDLKIINLLLNNNYLRIEKIAEELYISDRSVRNYVKRINEILEGIAKIQVERGKGLKLLIQSEEFYEIINDCSSGQLLLNNREDRVKYIIDYFIELDGITTLDELAHNLNIGKTTLINDLKEVELVLNEYHCKIESKKNTGSYLEYNELDIRMLISNYLCDGYNIYQINEKYANIDKDKFKNLKIDIYNFLKANNYNVTEIVLTDILKYIIIMVYRVNRGYTINHLEKRHEIIKNFSDYDNYAQKISELVDRYFGIKTTTNGKLYLAIPFFTRNAAINIDFSKKNITNAISNLMDKIRMKIYENVGIIINDKRMLNNLAIHLSYSLNRMTFNIKVKNILDFSIKEEYKLAYQLAEISANVIEKEKKLKVSSEEITFIAIHFGALLEKNRAKISELKNFALICENGLGTSVLLKARLNRLLKADRIDAYTLYEFKEADKSNYQVIFTTINLDPELVKDTNLPIIKIDTIFEEEEVRNSLENALFFSSSSLKSTNEKFLLSFIEDSNIQFFYNSNYKEILNQMMEMLFNNGKIDTNFMNYILEREETNPTILDNGIMVPHYTSSLVKEPEIMLGLVKKECFHNNRLVKLIILIVYPEKYFDSDLMLKVYDNIIDLGRDKSTLNRILNSTTVLDVKESIRET